MFVFSSLFLFYGYKHNSPHLGKSIVAEALSLTIR